MLYQAEKFDPLTDRRWDEGWVRERIGAIVADIDAAHDPADLWPDDDWDSWETPTPLKMLYVGAAGVVWGLGALERRGHARSTLDLPAVAQSVLEAWRAEPDFMRGLELPSPARAGLLSGEAGILAVAWQLSPDDEIANTLHERVTENVASDANDVMWGSPGTMLAAHAMYGWTGDHRWRHAWDESADELLRRREGDGLWSIHLYGRTARGIGPAHGLVGNVLALRQGLDAKRADDLVRDSAAALRRLAVREDGLATWRSTRAGPWSRTTGRSDCSGVPVRRAWSSRRRTTSTRICSLRAPS